MQTIETALGRLVRDTEYHLVLEDSILSLLFTFGMHPQNPSNEPMSLDVIVQATNTDRNTVTAALEGLVSRAPALVEERVSQGSQRAYRLTTEGVAVVRQFKQRLASVA
jgi:predicted transcriptional regulator